MSRLTSSRFAGVTWSKERRKWRAKIWDRGRSRHLGYFDDDREAAVAYLYAVYLREKRRIESSDRREVIHESQIALELGDQV